MANGEFNKRNPNHYKFSASPEGQQTYSKAEAALAPCRAGDIAQFSFIKAVVRTAPEFDNAGLKIGEEEFNSLNAAYEMWRTQMNMANKDDDAV